MGKKFNWGKLTDWLVVIGALSLGLSAVGLNLLGYLGSLSTYVAYAIGISAVFKLVKMFKK